MKRLFASLLALLLMLCAAQALADNATIAVRGRDGFSDYISSMLVMDDGLLLGSYSSMYKWSQEEGLTKLEGYSELEKALAPEDPDDPVLVFGDDEFELEEGDSALFYDSLYTADDKLYRPALIRGDEGAKTMLLVELEIADGDRFEIVGATDIGDGLFVDYGGFMLSPVVPEHAVYIDGVLYGLAMQFTGGTLMAAIDIDSEDAELYQLDTDVELTGMAAFDDERVLLIGTDDMTGKEVTKLLLYDAGADSLTEIGALPSSAGSGAASAPCYDAERGRLYYVLDGSVWRVGVSERGVGTPEAFGDMPLDVSASMTPVMLGDLYVLSSFEGVLGRDVTIERMPTQRLTIREGSYLQAARNAYFDFTAQHPEFVVSIVSGTSAKDSLLQAMMSRSSDVDIYMLSAQEGAYSALLSRGYMAELGGSEALDAFADGMYPVFQKTVEKGGELYAVPVEMYASVPALNLTALEKFGFTREDMPTTWPELFELFGELSGRMEEYPEYTLFDADTTLSQAKEKLFGEMMRCYLVWLEQDDSRLARGNAMLLSLLDAFEQIDWDGLGVPEEPGDMSQLFYYEPKNTLFSMQSATPVALTMGAFGDYELVTCPLALAEGEDPILPAETTMMFVNPFSKHRAEAIEYVERTVARLDDDTLATLMPDRNETVPDPSYEQMSKMYADSIADAQAALARAERNEDDELIAQQTATIESLIDSQAWFERTGRWMISEEGLAQYRGLAAYVIPSLSSLWTSGNLSSQTTQYLSGGITARQYVSDLEKTLQMQRLEEM